MISRALTIAIVVAAIGLAVLVAVRSVSEPIMSGEGVSVVDGDTVDSDGRRWRLVGFDAPEIFRARCPRERHRGIVAAARLVALIEAGARLEPVDGRDKYGRGLARLVLAGRDIASIMIAEGHARAYDGRTARQGWCSA